MVTEIHLLLTDEDAKLVIKAGKAEIEDYELQVYDREEVHSIPNFGWKVAKSDLTDEELGA